MGKKVADHRIPGCGCQMPIVKSIDSIAFHEAGHAVSHVLTGIPFKTDLTGILNGILQTRIMHPLKYMQ
jgi:hypothetical protein